MKNAKPERDLIMRSAEGTVNGLVRVSQSRTEVDQPYQGLPGAGPRHERQRISSWDKTGGAVSGVQVGWQGREPLGGLSEVWIG